MEVAYFKLKEEALANPARCYLLTGTEETLKKEFLQRLRNALQIEPGSFDETLLDAKEVGSALIVGAMLTAPLESSRRLVIVRHVQRLPAREVAPLAKAIASLPEWCCLVLWVEVEPEDTPGAEQRKATVQKLTEAVRQEGVLLKFDPFAGAELEKRLIAYAARQGKKLEPAAARYLLTLVDGAADRAFAELEKALYFVEPRQQITEHDLDQVVSPTREARVFALVEAIAEGKASTALERLQELFQTGARPEEVALKTLALIARQYRLIYQARGVLDHGCSLHQVERIPPSLSQQLPKEPNLIRVLQHQPFLRSRLQRQAERLTHAQLGAAFEAIKEADLALKGMEAGISAVAIMERLVLKLSLLQPVKTS